MIRKVEEILDELIKNHPESTKLIEELYILYDILREDLSEECERHNETLKLLESYNNEVADILKNHLEPLGLYLHVVKNYGKFNICDYEDDISSLCASVLNLLALYKKLKKEQK